MRLNENLFERGSILLKDNEEEKEEEKNEMILFSIQLQEDIPRMIATLLKDSFSCLISGATVFRN